MLTASIMKTPLVIYLGALSCLTATLIPQVSAHPPVWAQYKVHCPCALFHDSTVVVSCGTASALSEVYNMHISQEGYLSVCYD